MSLRHAGNLILSWASWLGVCLLVVVALGVVSGFEGGEPKADTESGEAGSPAAQLGRDECGSPVWALAVSPGGASLGAATIGGEVQVISLPSTPLLRLESGSMSAARSLAISPDGRVLAIAGLGTSVSLWDIEQGGSLGTLEMEGGTPKTVAFPAAGPLLAVGGSRRRGPDSLTLWDWRERRRRVSLDGHEGGINALAFSADGSILASSDSAGVVKLWETAKGRELASCRVSRPGNAVKAMVLSPDGHLLATAGLLEDEVRLWDVPSGHPRGTLPAPGGAVNGLAFSPDGLLLALAGRDGTAALYQAARARELGSVQATAAALEAVIFADDGRVLATGGSDGSLRLWDLEQALGDRRAAAW
jgi:WD40 repeat protein